MKPEAKMVRTHNVFRFVLWFCGALLVAPLAACSAGGTVPAVSNVSATSGGASFRRADSSTAFVTETPFASDTLADSVGLNSQTTFFYSAPDFGTIEALEKQLGVRHLREGILKDLPSYVTALSQLLDATGAKVDGVADCAGIASDPSDVATPPDIEAFDAGIGNRLESVEGPNEPDDRGFSDWASVTKACLPYLHTAEPQLPLLSPALSDPIGGTTTLGDITPLVTEGNFHRYYAGRNPGTAGWGATGSCGEYGNVLWAVCLQREITTLEPLEITETGYNSQTEVDEISQAKYLTRMFLLDLWAGVNRSYVFDLKDDPSEGVFAGDGLLRSDDSPKPAFTAIKNLIAYFSDRGPNSRMVPLHFSLADPDLDYLLFQRHDGSYELAIWDECESWNFQNGTPYVIAPSTQTVGLPFVPKSVSAEEFTDTGALVTIPALVAGHDVTVTADDHVTLLRFAR